MEKLSQILKLPLTMLVIVGVLNACCTKRECVNAFEQREIKLNGFTKQESERILVSSYIQGGNFTNLIDSASISSRTYSGNDTGDLIIWVPIDFNPKSDYSIEFKETGLIFKISEISTALKKCNKCFLTEDNYTELSSYKVNGQLKINSLFEIIK